MSIAETTQAVDEAVEEALRAQYRREALRRMLAATDALLWRLEDLNLQGVARLSLDEVRRMRLTLAELPVSVESAFIENQSVQEVLNGVFAVQDRLLAHCIPDYEPFDDGAVEHEADPKIQARILSRVRDCGKATLTEIYQAFRSDEGYDVKVQVVLMASTGVLVVDHYRSANNRRQVRYFASETHS